MARTKFSFDQTQGESANAFDYMNDAQIADIQAGTAAVDVSAAIQAAIDAVESAGGGSVFFPAGTYLVSSFIQLKSNVSIFGTGSKSVLIKPASTSVALARALDTTDIFISKLRFEQPVVGDYSYGLIIDGATHITVENCCFEKCQGGIGVFRDNGSGTPNNIKIVNNTFNEIKAVASPGNTLADGVYVADYSNNIIITGNYFYQNNRWGIAVAHSAGVTASTPDNVVVSNNIFEECGTTGLSGSVDVEVGEHITINGNHFIDSYFTGVNVSPDVGAVFGGRQVVISGNTFTQIANANFIYGVYAQPNVSDVLISSNTFYDITTRGVYIRGDACIINANHIYGCFIGITLQGGNDHAVTGNIIKADSTNEQGIEVSTTTSFSITGNTIDGYDDVTNGFGIRISAAATDFTISSNTITGGRVGLAFADAANPADFTMMGNSINCTTGILFGTGTISDFAIFGNCLSNSTTKINFGSITFSGNYRLRDNPGYVSNNSGLSSAIATGATIAHGIDQTPVYAHVTPADTGVTDHYITIDATNITVNYSGGGTHQFYWSAEAYK